MSGGLNLWFESALSWKITELSTITCKTLPFFTYTMLDFSVAIIVIMTGKKLYAILFPIKARKLNLNRSEFITAFSALFICSLINCHFLISLTLIEVENTSQLNSSSSFICTNDKWNDFYEKYWIYIDATVYSFLPFALIATSNITIILCLIKERRTRLILQSLKMKKLKKSQQSNLSNKTIGLRRPKFKKFITSFSRNRRMAIYENSENENISKIALYSRKRFLDNHSSLTIMLFLINISFSILTMPIVILQIVNELKINYTIELEGINIASEEKEDVFKLMKAIFQFLQFLNHSVNFFLYCVSGSTFRKEVKILFYSCYKNLCCK